MQGLVHAMQTQAQMVATLQAQVQAQERADVWWSSVLRTQFGDGAMEVAWAEFCWAACYEAGARASVSLWGDLRMRVWQRLGWPSHA
ncbi:hypothetical protein Taro_040314 [Colocasia esculenta]|uniref:Uncharacterized protein n=1 Tax=Colocasia esculenta TaxID=4460 RepID=A0A843WU65_COLES|nr:hypothetical protein [Colocasia esculenta]